MKIILSEKWIKASVVGTIWAASEIVFGSFLHNLRIPFSGNILTAIGIIILISVAFLWKEKGIFFRAGLICALMKTMSPSAVIFGPMIAIFTEALLLEIAVFVFGKNYFGFIIGAGLAMSWNLVQKILSYILFYGFDLIKVYKGLVEIAEKQLNHHFDLLWTPLLILLILYIIFGTISAIVGIKTGKKILKISGNKRTLKPQVSDISNKKAAYFNHSVIWLIVDVMFMSGGLLILRFTDWYIWSIYVIVVSFIWIWRYRRAFRKISNPKFWIVFVLITFITVFVFSRLNSSEDSLTKGIVAGIQMNFRAVLMILGFSVLAVELYNPIIKNYFARTSFKQLPLALELSFESLPLFVATIPDFKTAIRKPVYVFSNIILNAQTRLEELTNGARTESKIFIISGSKGEGKSLFVKSLIKKLQEKGHDVGGFYSDKQIQNDECAGYQIFDIETEQKVQFLLKGDIKGCDKIMKFSIINEGLEFGKAVLIKAMREKEIVVIDEVGLLELQDGGWNQILVKIHNSSNKIFIITARDVFVQELIAKYNWEQAQIVQISKVQIEVFIRQF